MNIEGAISNILNKGDTLGKIGGIALPMKKIADEFYGGNFLAAAIDHFGPNLLKFNIKEALARVSNPMAHGWAKPTIEAGVGAAIAGYLMKEIDLHPTLNRLGNFLTPLGINLAIYAVGLVFASGLSRGNPHGSYGYGGNPTSGFSPTWGYNP